MCAKVRKKPDMGKREYKKTHTYPIFSLRYEKYGGELQKNALCAEAQRAIYSNVIFEQN